jgi:hypothetical protein
MVVVLFVAGVLTGTSTVPAAASPTDPFAVRRITIPVELGPSPLRLPFNLARRGSRRTWTVKPAPPASVHRDDEDGPIILTEKGPLRCRGHRFDADKADHPEPHGHVILVTPAPPK